MKFMFRATAIISDGRQQRQAHLLRILNAAREGNAIQDLSPRALKRLQAYAETWFECAPNAMQWRHQHPRHWKRLSMAMAKTQLMLIAGVDGCMGTWDARPGVLASKNADLWKADKLFADFLVEFCHEVAACRGCGRYFLTTPKRRTYCRTRCGTNTTSTPAKRKDRHAKRHQKLGRVLAMLRKMTETRKTDPEFLERLITPTSRQYWKTKVTAKLGKESNGITLRWLNEATSDERQTPNNPYAKCEECAQYRKELKAILGGKA